MLMASACSKRVVNDVVLHVPASPRYVNLQKWAESDAEFVKRVTSGVHRLPHPTVVDSASCRQMYLRSYTFSRRRESVPEKTKKCLTKVKEQVGAYTNKKIKPEKQERKMKSVSSALAVASTFRHFVRRLVAERKVKKRASGRLGGGGFCMRRRMWVRKVKTASCGVLSSLFRRLVACTRS
uniref:Uncharacterized protein n=1 Tax=Kalanchoe fedtschenkoi TaxID=63787 RepID=A0A7N0ULS9_KALFE